MANKLQLRRDTQENWIKYDPILLEGEIGYETDTRLKKIGDGVKKYTQLNYDLEVDIQQSTGHSETSVMSQKAVSTELKKLTDSLDIFGEEISDVKNKAVLFGMTTVRPDTNSINIEYQNINQDTGTINIPTATVENAGVMSAEDKTNLEKSIKAVSVTQNNKSATITITNNDGTEDTQTITPVNTQGRAGLMLPEDKVKLNNLAVEGADVDLNTYYLDGVYFFSNKRLTNVPILNDSVVSARLTVLAAYDGSSPVITQVLNLNNLGGGEGNIYIRSNQNGEWKPWGKLQTNIEVGAIGLGQDKTFDDLIDNGIYSGVNVIQVGTDSNGYPITGYETFVLITVNGYLTGTGITQLKHSINTNGEMKTQSRQRISDVWSEWRDQSEIIPGKGLEIDENGALNVYLGTGLHFNNDVAGQCIVVNYGKGLEIDKKNNGALTVSLGTGLQFYGDEIATVERVDVTNWGSTNSLNNYKFRTKGTYYLEGYRSNPNDGLPIWNYADWHYIDAQLLVLSTNYNSVTQILTLHNEYGEEGDIYIRTYTQDNWKSWSRLQKNKEVGQVLTLDDYTENGMYSGVYTDGASFFETFVLIVANDYMVSGQMGKARTVSQLKYSIDTVTGQSTVKKRIGVGDDSISWGDWEDIGGGSSVDNYLGNVTKDYLRNGDLKSGVYYGTLSDYNGAPFILEVSTNFDNGGVQDSAKRAIKKLTVKQSNKTDSVSEFYCIGRYVNTAFCFSPFSEQKQLIYDNELPSLNHSWAHKTLFIDKFDDSLEIPQSAKNGQILYQYIINTAKSISNIGSVIINITPNHVSEMGIATSFQSIVEVIYENIISGKTTPVKYEKMIFNSANGNVYKLQTITELEQITV